MPDSLHKILIHGHNIIDFLSLHTNEDQIHYLWATSDPFISSIEKRKNKYSEMQTKMTKEAYALIEENEKSNEYE